MHWLVWPAAAAIVAVPVVVGIMLIAGWPDSKFRRLLAEAAGSNHLQTTTPEPGEQAAYAGTIDGVRVRLAFASPLKEIAHAGGAVKLARIRILAFMPRPAGFRIEIGQAGFMSERTFHHPDAEFDRVCAVETDDTTAADCLLASPPVRAMIITCVRPRYGSGRVDSQAVELFFCNHWSGAAGLKTMIADAVALARAFKAS
jgi:hypothetical protein